MQFWRVIHSGLGDGRPPRATCAAVLPPVAPDGAELTSCALSPDAVLFASAHRDGVCRYVLINPNTLEYYCLTNRLRCKLRIWTIKIGKNASETARFRALTVFSIAHGRPTCLTFGQSHTSRPLLAVGHTSGQVFLFSKCICLRSSTLVLTGASLLPADCCVGH